MKTLKTLLFVYLAFCCSCAAQTTSNFEWKTFDFSDSGIKLALPCEPSKSAKVFQKEPKLAQTYSYNCKKDNFEFSVSLAEHFDDFDPAKAKERFDGVEGLMRESLGGKADLSAKDTTFQTFVAREFSIENETRLAKAIHFQNKRGFYNVQVISQRKPNQSSEDFRDEFQKNTRSFFDSVKISVNE